jgi:hypothetical protein
MSPGACWGRLLSPANQPEGRDGPSSSTKASARPAVAPHRLFPAAREVPVQESAGKKRGQPKTVFLRSSSGLQVDRQIRRGFPQSLRCFRKGMQCRYPQTGELERSLLKDCYVHHDAQPLPLAWVLGQTPSGLFLDACADAGIRGNAAGTSAAGAFVRARAGRRCVFALPVGNRATTAAFRAGAASPGFVNPPCFSRTTPAFSGGGDCRSQHGVCQVCRIVPWPRWNRLGARSTESVHRGPKRDECDNQGAGEKRYTGSFAR